MDFHDHQLVKYDYYSPCSVSQSIMGRRKFRLGRAHKKYEQKRQATKKNPIGRPDAGAHQHNNHAAVVNLLLPNLQK